MITSLYQWITLGVSIPKLEWGIVSLSHIRPLLFLKGLVLYYCY